MKWHERKETFDAFVGLLNIGEVKREGRDIIIDLGTDPNGEYVEIELGRYSFYPTDNPRVGYNHAIPSQKG